MDTIQDTLAAALRAVTGCDEKIETVHSASGGCINRAYVVRACGRRYFIKLNESSRADMFAAEAAGLEALAASHSVRVPAPLGWGVAGRESYLVLEYLELGGAVDPVLLGEQLARMHRATWSQYGWRRDNTIGGTPQSNTPSRDWVEFWREHRLGWQLELAARNGYGGALQRRGDRLRAGLRSFFTGHVPAPSLLHGDLWSGNCAAVRGEPVIFDPAVYYGDRETDIAMTELFGGFSPRFYDAYRSHYPLDAGYAARKTLYNLYHVLNHLNLFGGGYLRQAEEMIECCLSEIH